MRKLAWVVILVGLVAACSRPVAKFTYSGEAVAPAEIKFENQSEKAVTYQWDFGDGNTSTEYSPTHIYANAGTYDVSLIATGCEMGEDTLLQQQYIVVDPEAEACDTIVMPENLVAEIIRKIDIAEFKRRQACPGIKITLCSFDRGYRFPIARPNTVAMRIAAKTLKLLKL